MQATIEIDLGPLAEEWEAVAYRLPYPGDSWLTSSGVVRTASRQGELPSIPCIIVRRKWVWPSWLKARWYAEAETGVAYCSDGAVAPEPCGKTWLMSDWREIPRWIDIPKIGGDWKQSLRENPNWRTDNGQKDT